MQNQQTFRLDFIDVIRAFAICMMLQGHFIDGLLAPQYRDVSNIFYAIWLYFRGITAPVFFTVSGFIFTFLLLKPPKNNKIGWEHQRVKKGIKRAITLIITAYILRCNIFNLIYGYADTNVQKVDVLQCIGLSLLFLVAVYLFSYKRKLWIMPVICLGVTFVLFLFEPVYNTLNYNYLPVFLANYFTKHNGSVFTIFPWFGYASFGGFLGFLFYNYRNHRYLYLYAISSCLGFGFLFFYSDFVFKTLFEITGSSLSFLLWHHDYLFERLGNVLFIFAFFILMRNILKYNWLRRIGQNTFSIYIIHYIILYGSLTGYGLYRFYHHQLTGYQSVFGAVCFIIVTVFLSFLYNEIKPIIREKIKSLRNIKK